VRFMGTRGRGEGNLFDAGPGPEDAVPSLEDLIRGSGRPRRTRRRGGPSRAPRPVGPLRYEVHQKAPVVLRRGLLLLRITLAAGVLLLGLVMTAVGTVEAADGYGAGSTLASAPACPAGVDPTTTTRDCVADVRLIAQDGVLDDGGEESVELFRPPESAEELFFPTFPGDRAFVAAVSRSSVADPADDSTESVVRAEFWQGEIVELTAGEGAGAVTVTTDSDPNNRGGSALGGALMGMSFAELGLLLLVGVRALRYRWLRPGLSPRMTIAGLCVTFLGLLVTSICLVDQPALVLLTLVVGPAVTACLLLCVEALIYRSWSRPGRRPRTSVRVTSP
jgi:hypothetical protein